MPPGVRLRVLLPGTSVAGTLTPPVVYRYGIYKGWNSGIFVYFGKFPCSWIGEMETETEIFADLPRHRLLDSKACEEFSNKDLRSNLAGRTLYV